MKKIKSFIVEQYKLRLSQEIIFVFLIGFAIRIFAWYFTYIINPDGALYIYQAKALYYGQNEKLLGCGLHYLSNLPFFIAGAYTIVRDWIIAAKLVSFFFGFGTLIPLYFLLKRFFNEHICALSTLIFALTPILIKRGADVVKGPVYWFFLVLGLYFFISQIHKKNKAYIPLILASVCYIMAAWARIEAVLFIFVSCFFILFFEKEKRIQKLILFTVPVFICTLPSVMGTDLLGIPVSELHRANEIQGRFISPAYKYMEVRSVLKQLAVDNKDTLLGFFLPEARNSLWLICLGTVINRILESFFYPFFVIAILGFSGIFKEIKKDKRILYCFLLAIGGFILLYINTMNTWVLENRYVAVMIFPCFVFTGLGIKKISTLITSKYSLKEFTCFLIIGLLILLAGLPKNLKPRDPEKIVFRQIGKIIAQKEGNEHPVHVSASYHRKRRISLYANLNNKNAPCPEPKSYTDWEMYAYDHKQFVQDLKNRNIKYFLWEENHWPTGKFNIAKSPYNKHFTEIGRWFHKDTGQMILFEFTP